MTGKADLYLSRLSDEAQDVLRRLAKKDALARPALAKSGVVDIVRRRGGCEKIVAHCPQSIWTKFVAMGCVEAIGHGSEWTVTPFGQAMAARSKRGAGQRARVSGACRATASVQPAKPVVNDQESPLAWLSRRKGPDGKPMVSAAQFAAGERLREDFHYANLNAKVTMSWSPALCASGGMRAPADHAHINDVMLRAKEQVNAALVAVGPELANILVDVCCHLKGLEMAEKNAGWPRRSGKVILGLALTRLARHYGFIRETRDDTTEARRQTAIRHWGQNGYRPVLDGDVV